MKYAAQDAKKLADKLVRSAGFSKNNVTLLTDKKATLRDIKLALVNLRQAGENDLVLFYFAGHGRAAIHMDDDEGDRLAWKHLMTYDADGTVPDATALSLDDLRSNLDELTARHQLCLLDSCYSGAGGRSVETAGTRGELSEATWEEMAVEGRLILSACQANEMAYEYDKAKQGLFTHFLLKGLDEGIAQTNDGRVYVDQLYSYLSDQVPRVAQGELRGRQHPVLFGKSLGPLPLTFAEPPPSLGPLQEAEGLYNDQAFDESIKLLKAYLPGAGKLVAEAYCWLGKNYLGKNDYDAALAAFDTALEKSHHEPEKQPLAHLGRGEVMLRQKKFDEAIEAYRAAILIDETNRGQLVTLYLAIEKEIQSQSAAGINYLRLARVIKMQGQKSQARRFAQIGIDRWLVDQLPSLQSYLQTGDVLNALWEDQEVRSTYEGRLEAYNQYLMHLGQGQKALAAGNLLQGRQELERALEINSDSAAANDELEEVKRREQECEQCLKKVRELIEKEDFAKAMSWYRIARENHVSHPDYPDLELEIKEGLACQAEADELLREADALEAKSELGPAIAVIKRVLRLLPHRADLRDRLEELSKLQRNWVLARDLLAKAVQCMGLGDTKQAYKDLRQAIRLSPDYEEVQTRLAAVEARLKKENLERFGGSDVLRQISKTGIANGAALDDRHLEDALTKAGLLPIDMELAMELVQGDYRETLRRVTLTHIQEARLKIDRVDFDGATKAINKIASIDSNAPVIAKLKDRLEEARNRDNEAGELLRHCRKLFKKREYDELLSLRDEHELADSNKELVSIFQIASQRRDMISQVRRKLEKSAQVFDQGEVMEAYYMQLAVLLQAGDIELLGYIRSKIEPVEQLIREKEEEAARDLPAGMVIVPAGFHFMGKPGPPNLKQMNRTCAFVDSYAIDRHAVTNRQYAKFLDFLFQEGKEDMKRAHMHCNDNETKPKNHLPDGWEQGAYPQDDHPVVGVDWFDAFSYAQWDGKRLPTEAEWEKAGLWYGEQASLRPYPWGGEFFRDRCNTAEGNRNKIVPVGGVESGASFYGAHDMLGNTWEWCQDPYVRRYPAMGEWPRNPGRVDDEKIKSDFAEVRVLRGGSWREKVADVGPYFRIRSFPQVRGDNIGFRCAFPLNLKFD